MSTRHSHRIRASCPASQLGSAYAQFSLRKTAPGPGHSAWSWSCIASTDYSLPGQFLPVALANFTSSKRRHSARILSCTLSERIQQTGTGSITDVPLNTPYTPPIGFLLALSRVSCSRLHTSLLSTSNSKPRRHVRHLLWRRAYHCKGAYIQCPSLSPLRRALPLEIWST